MTRVPIRQVLDPLLDPVLDLVLGRACLACRRPGPMMCPACTSTAARASIVRHLQDRPVAACGPYRGLLREAVLEYKERGGRALAPALGRLLAASALAAHTALPKGADRDQAPLVLVPIPAHPNPARGFSALQDIAQHAREPLAARGLPIIQLVRIAQRHAPVKGLGREARERQVHGTMAAWAGRTGPGLRVILLDDVLTSGATMREAIRALTLAGHRVVALAVIASSHSR